MKKLAIWGIFGILIFLAGTLEYVLLVHVHEADGGDNIVKLSSSPARQLAAASVAGDGATAEAEWWQKVDMRRSSRDGGSDHHRERLEKIGKESMQGETEDEPLIKHSAERESSITTSAALVTTPDTLVFSTKHTDTPNGEEPMRTAKDLLEETISTPQKRQNYTAAAGSAELASRKPAPLVVPEEVLGGILERLKNLDAKLSQLSTKINQMTEGDRDLALDLVHKLISADSDRQEFASSRPKERDWDYDDDYDDEEDEDDDNDNENKESTMEPEILVENDKSLSSRKLSPFEAAGNNIMLTLRTVQRFHNQRLPLLFDTWLSKVNGSNVFLMTDDKDPYWQKRAWDRGMHYVLSTCERYFGRENRLCCRTGTEMAQLFKEGNEHYDWLCHVDDDMYVRLPPLIELLSKFDPRRDAIYLGRSGSDWGSPRKVLKEATLGEPGDGYHFAVGGMFCLSRAMLELGRSYIVGGRNFSKTCTKTMEPDDVTIGFIAGVLLNRTLTRTEKIYTHGLHLYSTVNPNTLDQQVAFSYGYGSFHWGDDQYNAIDVPGALYSLKEDESQFRSLHCYLYPHEPNCVERLEMLIRTLANDEDDS